MGVGGHYLQTDDRWKGVEHYIPALDKTLWTLTRAVQMRVRGRSRSAAPVRKALAKFAREVRLVAGQPGRWRPTSRGSMSEAGCWLVSIANMLRCLRADVDGEEPTPVNLLRALQDLGLVTLTCYEDCPGVDCVNIVTRGRVQLARFEDFTARGAPVTKSEILRTGLKRGRAAIVAVTGHEYFGWRGDTHYVLVARRAGRSDWEMQDPADARNNRLLKSVRHIYQVYLYRRVPRRKRR